MTPLKQSTVYVPPIIDDSAPKLCPSKDDGICNLPMGSCQHCYPKTVELSRYIFTKDELVKLLEDAWVAGKNVGTRNQLGWDDSYKTTPMHKKAYVKSILP